MPLVFYRGPKSPYLGMTNIWSCFENPDFAHKTLLNALQIIDVSVIPDEELKTHRSIALLELVQKHIGSRDNFIERLQEWLEQDGLHEYLERKLFQVLVTYVLRLMRCDEPQKVTKLIEDTAIKEEYKDTMQTAAQYLQQQGLQQGMLLGQKEGVVLGAYQTKREDAKKFLAEGVSREVIKRVTGLSDVELDHL